MDTLPLNCSFDQLLTLEFFLKITIKDLERYNADLHKQLDNPSDDDGYRLLLDCSLGFHQKISHLQSVLAQVRQLIHGDSYGNQ